jgi:hypothetical protein
MADKNYQVTQEEVRKLNAHFIRLKFQLHETVTSRYSFCCVRLLGVESVYKNRFKKLLLQVTHTELISIFLCWLFVDADSENIDIWLGW